MCTIIDCILYMYSVQHLAELLALPSAVPDAINDAMDAPIHTYIRKQYRDRADLLLTLFSNSTADIDVRNGDYLTALHLAAQVLLYLLYYRTVAYK